MLPDMLWVKKRAIPAQESLELDMACATISLIHSRPCFAPTGAFDDLEASSRGCGGVGEGNPNHARPEPREVGRKVTSRPFHSKPVGARSHEAVARADATDRDVGEGSRQTRQDQPNEEIRGDQHEARVR